VEAPTRRPADALDAIDRKILALLEADATIPLSEIAHRVGLTQTPCWKRIQRMEREGTLQARVAILDPAHLGLSLSALVFIQAADHSQAWMQAFCDHVQTLPQVTEVLRLAGDIDYLLRINVRDTADFDRFYQSLIAAVPLRSVTSRFVMETIKTRGSLVGAAQA
jgi:Lrp/AsnC family transcriptional regulator